MNLLDITYKFMGQRDIINIGHMFERGGASIGCHLLNLANLETQTYYDKGQLNNFRSHMVVITTSGGGKSLMVESFLHPVNGLMSSVDTFTTSLEGTFSREAWLGTIERDPESGELYSTGGVFDSHKKGIIGADEYQRLATLMDGDGREHDEVYLLQALSRDMATKKLAHGSVDVEGIGTTLWAGMRPVPSDKTSGTLFNVSSGLFRRILCQLHLINRVEAEKLNNKDELNFRPAGSKLDRSPIKEAFRWTKNIYEDMVSDPPYFDMTELGPWFARKRIPYFDRKLYKRLAMGHVISKSEKLKGDITVHLKDVQELLQSEYTSRKTLRHHIYDAVAYSIVNGEDGQITKDELLEFLEDVYQLNSHQSVQLFHQARGKSQVIEVDRGKTLRVTEHGRRVFEGL